VGVYVLLQLDYTCVCRWRVLAVFLLLEVRRTSTSKGVFAVGWNAAQREIMPFASVCYDSIICRKGAPRMGASCLLFSGERSKGWMCQHCASRKSGRAVLAHTVVALLMQRQGT
jgi:hypothetical protein